MFRINVIIWWNMFKCFVLWSKKKFFDCVYFVLFWSWTNLVAVGQILLDGENDWLLSVYSFLYSWLFGLELGFTLVVRTGSGFFSWVFWHSDESVREAQLKNAGSVEGHRNV